MPRPARSVTVRIIGKPSDAGLAAIAGLLLRRDAERPPPPRLVVPSKGAKLPGR